MKTLAFACLAGGLVLCLGHPAAACRGQETSLRIVGARAGRIVGIVEDRDTSRLLDFANVIIVDTTRGATARNGGRFALEDLPQGVYRVKSTFVGYEPQTVGDVRVEANATTVLKFCLVKVVETSIARLASAPVVDTAGAGAWTPSCTPVRATSNPPSNEIVLTLPVDSVDEAVALQAGTVVRSAAPRCVQVASNGGVPKVGESTIEPEVERRLNECGCGQAQPPILAQSASSRAAEPVGGERDVHRSSGSQTSSATGSF